jgi:chromosome segregation ATPase
MQKNFIEEIENRSKQNIQNKEISILSLTEDIGNLMNDNLNINEEISSLQEKLIEVSGSTEKIKKLGNLKGKISQKVSTITNEHKFFSENTVCPTCTQSIEEEFRLNRIKNAQDSAKELQSGYKELEQAIKKEEEREQQFINLSKEVTSLTHGISQNNTKISEYQKQIKSFESEIQKITNQLKNRNSEHEKLKEFESNLNKIFEDLSSKKELITYNEFAYSLLKDSGVKSKIIKKYLPLINQQINRSQYGKNIFSLINT